jgi:thioredoxin reductase
LGVYAANSDVAMHLAPLIRNWSSDVTLFTDGADQLSDEQRATLTQVGIRLRDERVVRLEERAGPAVRVILDGGATCDLGGMFIGPTVRPRTELAQQLGCELVHGGMIPGQIATDQRGETTVPGVYAAGDVTTPIQQLTIASASGVTVGAALNFALVQESMPSLSF